MFLSSNHPSSFAVWLEPSCVSRVLRRCVISLKMHRNRPRSDFTSHHIVHSGFHHTVWVFVCVRERLACSRVERSRIYLVLHVYRVYPSSSSLVNSVAQFRSTAIGVDQRSVCASCNSTQEQQQHKCTIVYSLTQMRFNRNFHIPAYFERGVLVLYLATMWFAC